MIFSLALLSFFTSPMMLGWLIAASAPLIIHLLNKRKYREMSWAAIEFLLAAMRKNSKRIRIEQWILLAVRTLAIALLVLAVAEPFLEQTGLKFIAGQRTHKILVLDGSFSMAYKPTDKSRWDRAKELAAQIVDESQQGDGFTLVLLSDPPRAVVGTPAFEQGDFVEEIENLRLPHSGADLPATLATIEEVLRRAQKDQPKLVQSEVYFLTDLGRAGWVPEFAGPQELAAFRDRSKKLSEAARLVVIDLGQTGSENLAVGELTTTEPFATIARDVTITAQVQNFGRQEQTQRLVEFFVDGRRAGEDYVNLAPGGQTTVGFSYRFDTAGEHTMEVRLESDRLEVDNHRWLSIPVKDQLRVLCVDGKPGASELGGATAYLAVALAPRSKPGSRPFAQVDVVNERLLLERDLNSYDVLFLANVEQFTRSEAQVLLAYLKNGGGLVFFLGDHVRADSYNEHLFAEDRPNERVIPAKLESVISGEPQYFFQPGDYKHPIIRAFMGQENAGLLTTPVYRYFKMSLPEQAGQPFQSDSQARKSDLLSAAKVALAFENGDPVIVEESLQRGRSIVVATSADASWTTMPVWPSFVPIVQELLAAAVGGQSHERNITVGETLGDSLRTVATDVRLDIRPPQGEPKQVRLTSDGDASKWAFNETDQSGIYVAQFGAPVSRNDTFAVNVDTAESDLTKLDVAELRSDEVWPSIQFVYETNWQNLDEKPTGEITRRSGLHRWFLTIVLGLLFVETFLAWRFGHRTS